MIEAPEFEYQNAYQLQGFLCFSQRPEYTEMPDRKIESLRPDMQLDDNTIKTNKYTCLTFLPLNLMDQFSQLANVYFLVIGLLQMIPDISISAGKPVIYMPLLVVVAISAIKDLVEDLKRKRSDEQENSRKTVVIKSALEENTVMWRDVRVGDIVKVRKNEFFPADMVILQSSDQKGYLYVETKNLDGETNLQRKNVPKDLQNKLTEKVFKNRQQFEFSYEKPNPYIYSFNGSLINNSETSQSISIDANNFVLRGCSLRNTDWVYGLVSYAGHDTKIMLNSIKARPKHSGLERKMNIYIMLIFATQMFICFATAIYSSLWFKEHRGHMSYLHMAATEDNQFQKSVLVRWGTWTLIFTNFVPISLIVSLEMVKFIQGIRMSEDPCTNSITYGIPLTVQSSNLNEELGQVEYIFSDQTGTLTSNIMKFKKLIVHGTSWGDDSSLTDEELSRYPQVTNVEFRDRKFFDTLKRNPNSPQSRLIAENLLLLVTCHTVLAEQKPSGELEYNASSPDELAFLNFAQMCGYQFLGMDDDNNMTICINGKDIFKFKLLYVLQFSSARQRQSVILRSLDDQQITILTKGADNVIEARMEPMNQDIQSKTWSSLENFARFGLRTLLLAQRRIDSKEFENWERKYIQATNAISRREQLMEKVQQQIQVNLQVIGATAIQDLLQDKVGETIEGLRKAGIKVWVLTGDKIETAINIAYSCKLLDDGLKQIIIDGNDNMVLDNAIDDALALICGDQKHGLRDEESKFNSDNYNQLLEEGRDQFKSNQSLPSPRQAPQQENNNALILTGSALVYCMSSQEISSQIMRIAQKCSAVVCCRVSPKQKAEVVTMVRTEKPEVITLAIGDGANDVNMITAAHVGVGIKGVEGQQAARASDFSVGQFKVLGHLVLHHGRESYRKNSALICYNFFKNMLLVMPMWWYGFENGFSGTALYDPFIYQLFNMCYTSLPIVVYAIYDEQHDGAFLMKNPVYYQQGLKDELFNYKAFIYWLLYGMLQAGGIMACNYLGMGLSFGKGGMNFDFANIGMMVYGSSVLISNIKIFLFSNTFSHGNLIVLLGSVLFYILNMGLVSRFMSGSDIYNTFMSQFGNINFYLCTLLAVGVTSLIDCAFSRFFDFIKNAELQNRQLIAHNEYAFASIGGKNKEPGIQRGYTGFAFSTQEIEMKTKK